MCDEYDLPPLQARVCRLAAAFFAFVAAVALATPIATLVLTGNPLAQWRCSTEVQCGFYDGSLSPLDEEERAAITASPDAATRYAHHLAHPPIWIGLAILSVLSTTPFAILMFGVAMALRALGTAKGIGGALAWMRLTAWSALAAAIAPPIIGLLQSALLLPGTPHGPGNALEVDGGLLFLHGLLATASFAVVWALDAGRRAQRDLAEIV